MGGATGFKQPPTIEPDRLPRSRWIPALLHATFIAPFILGLFYYWFGVADRYAVFLYHHLGATPFDSRTSSRYWMSGLVAAGAVMVLNTIACWMLGQVAALHYLRFCPPAWWCIWLLCAPPLVIGIPAISMTVNSPTLPVANAVFCTAAVLIGLALALAPGSLAAQKPAELGWLALGGAGLMPVLLLLRAVELPGQGLVSRATAFQVAGGGIAAGVVWLGIVSIWRARRAAPARPAHLFLAGLGESYLLMPLLHYALFTPPGFRYITTSSNFFATHPGLQAAACILALVMAWAATRFQ